MPDQPQGAVNSQKLELLWRGLENAKLQLDHCHNYVREIRQDRATRVLPSPDGNFVYSRALSAEESAIQAYFRALNDLKAALLLERGSQLASPEAITDAAYADEFGLTAREREVLALVASGKSSKAIAHHFGVTFKTVTTHRYRLLKKLDAHNTADLTRIAIKMGLV